MQPLEACLTPGQRVTLIIPADVGRVFVPGTRNRATEYLLPGGTVLLLPDDSGVPILPGDARPDLAAAAYDAVTLWAPIRCGECIKAPSPCEDCAGDPDRARLYGLLADALEGRAAGPLWERAGKGGRVSVRVTVTRAGEKPWEAGKLNTGPLEAAGFLAGVVDRLRAMTQGGSGE